MIKEFFSLVSHEQQQASDKARQEMSAAYAAAKRLNGGVYHCDSPINLSAVVQTSGGTKHSFPLPGGRAMGREGFCQGLGLGLAITSPTCHSIEYVPELNGYWLELKGIDKSGTEATSFVLVLEGKEGKEAIHLTFTLSQRQMFDGYNAAKNQPKKALVYTEPIELKDQIQVKGTTQSCFSLPGGRSMGREGFCQGLGLGRSITSPTCHSIEYVPELNGYWLELKAKDKNGMEVRTFVLVDDIAAGQSAIRLTLSPIQRALFDSYQEAKRTSPRVLQLELRDLVGAQNYSKATWLTPSGDTLKSNKSLSLPKDKDLASFTATQIHYLGDERFVIWATARYSDGGLQKVRLLSTNEDLSVIGATETYSAQTCKGFALDRYAAHLAALAGILGAEANPYYPGSKLTGENYVPNMRIAEAICHSKWGGDADEVFKYILRYGRMMRWHGITGGSVLLANPSHCDTLRDAAQTAGQELAFQIGVATLIDWAKAIIQTPPPVAAELETLQALADLGLEEALKARRYSPTIENAALTDTLTTPSTSWQDRITTLTTQESYEALTAALDQHLNVHSLYWEEPYHLTLVKCCSYLLENRGGLTTAQHDEVKQKVLTLYPELSDYTGAWRTLESEAAALISSRQTLTLVRFNLAETLNTLKTPKIPRPETQSQEPNMRGAGKIIEIPELRAFEHEGNNVTAKTLEAYLTQAESLQQSHPNNTSQIADTALKAVCKILAADERYWRSSQTLAGYKNDIIPTQQDLPKLHQELDSFDKAVTLLSRIEKLYTAGDEDQGS